MKQLLCIAAALIFVLAACTPTTPPKTGMSSRTTKQVESYGAITAEGVIVKRNKTINRFLKKCGMLQQFLGGVQLYGQGPATRFGRQAQATCRAGQEEQQAFYIYAVRPGQTIQAAVAYQQQVGASRFNGRPSMFISTKGVDPSNCLVIVTNNKIVPVVSGKSGNRFLFKNPLAVKTAHSASVKAQAVSVERDLKQARADMRKAQMDLTGNRAYESGRCNLVKQDPLPPKPDTISPSKAKWQANGRCVAIVASRHGTKRVIDGLAQTEEQLDLLIDHESWRRSGGPRMCGSIPPPDFWDFLTGMCRINSTGDGWCMRQHVDRCTAAVMDTCMAPLKQWRYKVKAIEAEPIRLRTECQSCKVKIANLTLQIPALEQNLVKAQQAVQALPPIPQSLPIADVMCGTTGGNI